MSLVWPLVFISFMTKYSITVNGEGKTTTFFISPESLIAEIPESEAKQREILRYGFQDTKACRNFKIAFVCVRKCLDLNYDVARADKNCVCKCFYKKDKFNPRPLGMTLSDYKSGAPSTNLPFWAPHKKTFAPEESEEEESSDDQNVPNNKFNPTKSSDGEVTDEVTGGVTGAVTGAVTGGVTGAVTGGGVAGGNATTVAGGGDSAATNGAPATTPVPA